MFIGFLFAPNRQLVLTVLFTLAIAVVFQSCNRCKPIGSVCESVDNSVVILDGETYSFRQERIVNTRISEKDSVVLLNYSVSRNGNHTNSNVDIGFGFIISLKLNRFPGDSLSFQSGTIEFIKDNVGGDFYNFQSPLLEVNTYQCCACGSTEPGILAAGGPDKLILTLKGPAVKDSTQQKQVEFRVNYTTRKSPLEAC